MKCYDPIHDKPCKGEDCPTCVRYCNPIYWFNDDGSPVIMGDTPPELVADRELMDIQNDAAGG